MWGVGGWGSAFDKAVRMAKDKKSHYVANQILGADLVEETEIKGYFQEPNGIRWTVLRGWRGRGLYLRHIIAADVFI